MRSLAKINSIKETWSNPAAVKEAQNRLANTRSAKESEQKKRDFEFILDDQHTYYVLSDFKKAEARNKAQWWLETRQSLLSRTEELNRLRARYSSGTDTQKAQIAPQIRLNEDKLEQIEQDLHNQEKEIRKIELTQ